MPKVGVLLAGCGMLDGAEIHEATLTLLALDQQGATPVCCAPNVDQAVVMDHQTRQPMSERRNVLREAARIARGNIRDAATVRADELDALIIPGGFGAAKNLSTFAEQGPKCTVQPAVEKLIADCVGQKKPIGAICIAPAMLARVLGKLGIKARLTIGNDAATARAIEAMGCVHEAHAVDEIAVDAEHRIVTTPAYMLGPGPAAVHDGIRRLVEQVLKFAR